MARVLLTPALLAASTTMALFAQGANPVGYRASPTLDLTWRMGIHNAFWHGDSLADTSASGPKQHLLDDLYIDRARALEFDLHAHHASREFHVYHTSKENYSFCNDFRDCLNVLRTWHLANPLHDPLFLNLEFKQTGLEPDSVKLLAYLPFFHALQPKDLDSVIDGKLRQGSQSWIFTPGDYLRWCQSTVWPVTHPNPATRPDFNATFGEDLRSANAACGWPTIDQLRGKIILTVHGAWLDNENMVTRYINELGVRKALAFPMASFFGSGTVHECGRSGVCNWDNQQAFVDIVTLNDSEYGGPPFYNQARKFYTDFRNSFGLSRASWDLNSGGAFLDSIQSTQSMNVRGTNIHATDAPRHSLMNSKLIPYSFLPIATGCLYIPFSNQYLPGCDPKNLYEPSSAIQVHAWAPPGGGINESRTRDQFIYLAKPLRRTGAGFRAFVSTRTESHHGGYREENYGPSYTGRMGCIMARETLDPDSPFFAMCRYRHRNSWDEDVEGTHLIWRTTKGGRSVEVLYNTNSDEDISGKPSVDNFYQINHDAAGKCFEGYMRVTEETTWVQPIGLQRVCFDRPLNYIGLATDGGDTDLGVDPAGGRRLEGHYLFSNITYSGKYETTGDLAYYNVGMPVDALVYERSYLDGLCATEITKLVQITQGGFRLQFNSGVYAQRVQLKNTTGKDIQGKINLQFWGLDDSIGVQNAGVTTTTCRSPISRVLPVSLPAAGWKKDETITVDVQFHNPQNLQIRYTPLILDSDARL